MKRSVRYNDELQKRFVVVCRSYTMSDDMKTMTRKEYEYFGSAENFYNKKRQEIDGYTPVNEWWEIYIKDRHTDTIWHHHSNKK